MNESLVIGKNNVGATAVNNSFVQGENNQAGGNIAATSEPLDNVAAVGTYAHVDLFGERVHGGGESVLGEAQVRRCVYMETVAASTSGYNQAYPNGDSTNHIVIPNTGACLYKVKATAYEYTANESAGFTEEGLIDNDGTTTAIVGTPAGTSYKTAGASTWGLQITADNTNDALKIEIQSNEANEVKWCITYELVQSRYLS